MMEFNPQVVECVSSKYMRHFLKEPKQLSCGHLICQQCIPTKNSIKCASCNETNKFDLTEVKESLIVKHILNVHLNDLYKNLESNFFEILTRLKESINTAKEIVNLQIDHIKQEVELRIESLKIELDKLLKEFNEDLEEKRRSYINNIEKCLQESELGELELQSLSSEAKNSEDQSLNKLYEHDEILANLRQLNHNLANIHLKTEFEVNKTQIDSNFIGKIIYDDPLLVQIKSGVFIKRHSDVSLYDFCLISKDRLLGSNYKTKKLYLYDDNLNLIKTINQINDSDFKPYAITSNQIDIIFFTDFDKHTVTAIDFDFKLLNVVGSVGSGNSELCNPCGICFDGESLYVCDFQNKRIQILNEDLSFRKNYKLDFTPWHIKVINNLACIRSFDDKVIYFYDTITFNQSRKYAGYNGLICSVNNNYFGVFDYELKVLYYYSKDGTLIDNVKLLFKNDIKPSQYDSICYFQNKFVLSINQSNKLIKF